MCTLRLRASGNAANRPRSSFTRASIVWFAIFILIVALIVLLYVPCFLNYSNVPRKADAIVLFVGPGNEGRLKEAQQLIHDGYASYLIISAYGEVFMETNNGAFERISNQSAPQEKILLTRKAGYYRNYIEDTHVEALEAKRMLDARGLRSAVLVSSPYHMRRIRIIAGSVFRKGRYSISFVPTRFESQFTFADWRDRHNRQTMLRELVKIGWFLVYELFQAF